MKINWEKYFVKTAELTPRELLVESLRYVKGRDVAVDIGAGSLRDSKYLLEEGFDKVIAVDADPAFVKYAQQVSDPRFHYEQVSLIDFGYEKETYDLVNAQMVLPYLSEDEFVLAIEKITDALKPGGVFTGAFFGNRDEQILPEGVHITLVTPDELKTVFSGYEIVKFQELEEDKPSVMGVLKHFHEISIIARKI